MTDCPPIYKNPQLESFGEQKYVHAELLQQFGCNDEYLLQLCRKIEYLTPPAVRKHFILRDSFYEAESYGAIVSGDNVIFDNNKEKNIYVDFNDNNLIDTVKTTAFIDQRVQTDGSNKAVIKQCTVPIKQTTTINSNTRNYSPWTIRDQQGNITSDDMTCNEYWYIGFDRNRNYETRPNWLNNMLNGEIPGISRAQTFKPKTAGLLESVVLNLKGGTNTGMPLVVEIRKTELIDGVLTPVNSDEPCLAYKEVKFENSDPGVYSIVFDNPPIMDPTETYAIVLLSPLSHHTNCYWIGGWNSHCHADVYPDGNAFYSWNSGYNWIRYGKDDTEVDYHWGQYAPQDFAFQCHIKQIENVYVKDTNYYLYLKPILSNPVTQVVINADDNIAESGTSIVYQVSQNGTTWTTVGESKTVTFTNPVETTFVRARLKTTNNANTPRINNILVTLTMNAAKEMYAKTKTYYPKIQGVLSADVWGRIFAPFEVDPTVTCTAEIISEKVVYETFTIIEPNDLPRYTWISDLDKDAIEKSSNLTKYIQDNPSVVRILREHQIYVLGFITDFQFVTPPAYPIKECNLTPAATGTKNKSYGEWYDFTVDYDEDTLTFRSGITLAKGSLTVAYNPVFIQGLTAEEVGFRNPNNVTTDGDVNDEGLILDYFKEKFTVNEDHVETRRISLRALPLDPIRHLYYNGEELKQDRDYSIDFNKKEIVFPIVNDDKESSILNVNDTVEIIYTPNIDDNGISIAWYAKRTNLLKQARIQPYYIEYKA